MIQRYAQFWLFRNGSKNSFSTIFVYSFSRKMFLMLYSINWPNFLVCLPLLFEILGMCIARRNFSLAARYSLKFTRCSLLVVKSLVTRCKIHSLLVEEVARCKKSLVTRCRSCSLQNITRYSLQNSLVTRCRSCSLQKITRYSLQNLLVTRCRSCSIEQNMSFGFFDQDCSQYF